MMGLRPVESNSCLERAPTEFYKLVKHDASRKMHAYDV